MALEDFADSEVAIAVAATAALMSPRVRGILRQGAVYGLAGVLMAGDVLGTVVQSVGRGAQRAGAAAATTAGDAADAARTAAARPVADTLDIEDAAPQPARPRRPRGAEADA